MQQLIPRDDVLYLLALLNSLALNYYIRNKISSHVSISFLYEMPIPMAKAAQKTKIVELSRQLMLENDSKGYFSELGKKKKIDPVAVRAQIEAIVAKELYGLTKEDWDYLTSTFIYGDSESRRELNAIIAATKELM